MAILGANLSVVGYAGYASETQGFCAESLGHWHTMSDQLTHKTNVSKHLGLVPDLVQMTALSEKRKDESPNCPNSWKWP